MIYAEKISQTGLHTYKVAFEDPQNSMEIISWKKLSGEILDIVFDEIMRGGKQQGQINLGEELGVVKYYCSLKMWDDIEPEKTTLAANVEVEEIPRRTLVERLVIWAAGYYKKLIKKNYDN